jgi:hypothetical protein
MIGLRFGEVLDGLKGIEFRQRLYTVEELQEIYASWPWSSPASSDGNGKRGEPSAAQSRSSSKRVRG